MYSPNSYFVRKLIIEIVYFDFPSEVKSLISNTTNQLISITERQDIKTALLICGFEVHELCDFIIDTEFGTWRSFTFVDSNVFATLGARLAFEGFNITATQTISLSILKFWVEDKYRMKENFTSTDFEQEIKQYFPLYQTFLIAQCTSHIIPNGPEFSLNGFTEFSLGTKQILQSVLGSRGAPLSYIIRNSKDRPHITRGSTPRIKICWKAPMVGATFNADNRRVWTYLLQQCQNTPG